MRIPKGLVRGELTTTTPNDEFVIIDFTNGEGGDCPTIRIPRPRSSLLKRCTE